nr:hypothetical protein [Paenibacillus chinjuensis]
MIELQHQLEKALKEIEALKQENQLLKLQLSKYGTQEEKSKIYENKIAETSNVVEVTPKPSIHQYSSPNEKIELFRSLFRGRDNVYPVRWINKTGKWGILRRVKMNGHLFVRNHKQSAPTVLIKHLNRSQMILLLNISMQKRIERLVFIQCYRTKHVGFMQWTLINKTGNMMSLL